MNSKLQSVTATGACSSSRNRPSVPSESSKCCHPRFSISQSTAQLDLAATVVAQAPVLGRRDDELILFQPFARGSECPQPRSRGVEQGLRHGTGQESLLPCMR